MRIDTIAILILLAVACSLLPAALPAQEPPTPSPELAKYDRLIGTFTGSGKVWYTPEAPPGEWTARTSTKKVLDGFFVREDTEVSFGGEGAPGPLLFRTFYGYDPERKRYVAWALSNMGEVTEKEIHWQGDKMIQVATALREGQPMVDRWETALGGDGESYTFTIHEALGDGAFYQHVQGTYRRATLDERAFADVAFFPPAEPMHRFSHLDGVYRVTGKMVPMPGIPAQPFAGTETYAPMWGGSLYGMVVEGEPAPHGSYVGVGALGWNEHDDCYTSLWIDNMGQAALSHARWHGSDLVFTASSVRGGEPVLERSTLACSEAGVISMVGHTLWGTHAPYEGFTARFTREK